jgi:hypothetical protein
LQVAARVKSDDEKDEWFVVKVIHFDKETKEYVSQELVCDIKSLVWREK